MNLGFKVETLSGVFRPVQFEQFATKPLAARKVQAVGHPQYNRSPMTF
jgi:hypothetical protein